MLLGILREIGTANTHVLADRAGHSTKVVLQSLRYLAKAGKVKQVSKGMKGPHSFPSTWKAV
jgi:GTP-sensing pleiotropic transcriptional regulator CodY